MHSYDKYAAAVAEKKKNGEKMRLLLLLLISDIGWSSAALPVVDKGVFVITGVRTCRSGAGYCILGPECAVDAEFRPDPDGGHCDGLRKAFSPRASFVCCEAVEVDSAPMTTTIVYEERTEISVEGGEVVVDVGCGAAGTCPPAAITRRLRSTSPTTTHHHDPGSFICTGALIHPSIILTTATCIARIHDAQQFEVLLNWSHIPHPSRVQADHHHQEEGERHSILTTATHPEYGGGVGRGVDLGLVLIAGRGECTVCLGGGGACVVQGYSHPNGATESDGLLHEAEQVVVPCGDGNNSSSTCAAGREGAEACFSPRDSGSPLTCTTPSNRTALAGVFSHGFHCGSATSPVHYTNVAAHAPWIGAKVSEMLLRL